MKLEYFRQILKKNFTNNMKRISVGAQVFHAEREAFRPTDTNNEANKYFCSYEIASTAYEICCTIQNPTGFRDDFNACYLVE